MAVGFMWWLSYSGHCSAKASIRCYITGLWWHDWTCWKID